MNGFKSIRRFLASCASRIATVATATFQNNLSSVTSPNINDLVNHEPEVPFQDSDCDASTQVLQSQHDAEPVASQQPWQFNECLQSGTAPSTSSYSLRTDQRAFPDRTDMPIEQSTSPPTQTDGLPDVRGIYSLCDLEAIITKNPNQLWPLLRALSERVHMERELGGPLMMSDGLLHVVLSYNHQTTTASPVGIAQVMNPDENDNQRQISQSNREEIRLGESAIITRNRSEAVPVIEGSDEHTGTQVRTPLRKRKMDHEDLPVAKRARKMVTPKSVDHSYPQVEFTQQQTEVAAPVEVQNKYVGAVARYSIPMKHKTLPGGARFVRKVTHAEYVSYKTWLMNKKERARRVLHPVTRAQPRGVLAAVAGVHRRAHKQWFCNEHPTDYEMYACKYSSYV